MVTYAYLVFQKTGVFMQSLKEWNTQSTTPKTFENFQRYMRSQYRELKAAGGLTIQNSSLNMTQEIKNHQDEISHNIQEEIRAGITDSMQTVQQQMQMFSMGMNNQENIHPNFGQCSPVYTPEQYHDHTPTPFHQMAPQNNAFAVMQHNQPYAQMMETIKTMQNTIDNLTLSNQNQGRQQRSNKGTLADLNPRTGLPWKRYCWSCGCCGHHGRNCPSKKKGHKDDATFKNRMNGSNENCL